ncbi:MAG: alkyl hydroperoxide reductase/Thiol specific antioxidant/Mal allergen [Nevskia sp.]|nr:alkyl hydroperoxide reductase/Thiol specific antioxidant/Mal allergen [Nevskia sp.]
MSLTPSNMLALGTLAPDFTLPDTLAGGMRNLQQLKSARVTLIMFICNHCPYVKHVQRGLVQLALDYQPRGVSFVAISSNDAQAYPQDGPEQMRLEAQRAGYHFPYLYDETQAVARAYRAACTPDFFVFDGDLKLAYRGQFDDSRPHNGKPVTGRDIRAALDALLDGKAVNPAQIPSVGCNIKWASPRA